MSAEEKKGLPQIEDISSILGIHVADPLTAACCQFLQLFVNHEGIEIEGKLGRMVMKNTPSASFRVDNVVSAAALSSNPRRPFRFESGVETLRFEILLDILGRKSKPQRRQTIDTFFTDLGEHIRVSRDKSTNQILSCIVKKRIENGELDMIVDTNTSAAVRVSVRSETDVPLPSSEARAVEVREKDRYTFKMGIFVFDLTKTITYATHNPHVRTEANEVEIEIDPIHVKELMFCAERSQRLGTNEFSLRIKELLDALRGLHYLSMGAGVGIHIFRNPLKTTHVATEAQIGVSSPIEVTNTDVSGSTALPAAIPGSYTASTVGSDLTAGQGSTTGTKIELGKKRIRQVITIGNDEEEL